VQRGGGAGEEAGWSEGLTLWSRGRRMGCARMCDKQAALLFALLGAADRQGVGGEEEGGGEYPREDRCLVG
jgi:hypothetical protein